jgi:transcription initiation factor TFIID TATA-box-binding protein
LRKFPQVLHDPEIYGGRVAYFRSTDISGEVTIFPSGKMISVGTKSETEAFRALERVKEFLIETGFVRPLTLEKKIQNIVLVADFFRAVNLEELAQNCKMVYEPEQFPGGILRIEEQSRATALVYASGKVVIVGLKGSAEIERLIRKLEDILGPYV